MTSLQAFEGIQSLSIRNKLKETMKTQIIKNTFHVLAKKLFFFCLSMSLTAFIACSNDDGAPDFSSEDEETANFESQEDYYFDDADDHGYRSFCQ